MVQRCSSPAGNRWGHPFSGLNCQRQCQNHHSSSHRRILEDSPGSKCWIHQGFTPTRHLQSPHHMPVHLPSTIRTSPSPHTSIHIYQGGILTPDHTKDHQQSPQNTQDTSTIPSTSTSFKVTSHSTPGVWPTVAVRH